MVFSPLYKGFTLTVAKKVYKNTGNWREDFDSSGNPIVDHIEDIKVKNCYMQRITADESEEYGVSLNQNIYKVHIPRTHDISSWKGSTCSFGQGNFSIVFTSLYIPNMPKGFTHNKFILVEDTKNG